MTKTIDTYGEFPAPAPLAPVVECLWIAKRQPGGGSETHTDHLTLPDVRSDLVFDMAAGSLYLVGPLTRAVPFPCREDGLTVGVRFKPWGAHAFLKKPMNAYVDRSAAATELWDRFGVKWQQRLATINDVDELLSEMTRPLWQAAKEPPDDVRIIAKLWPHLPASLAELAEVSGLSDRQLRRTFAKVIGLTPAAVQKILRFQDLIRAFSAQGVADGADAAARVGYYDQAHMLNDFRRFTAATPRGLWG